MSAFLQTVLTNAVVRVIEKMTSGRIGEEMGVIKHLVKVVDKYVHQDINLRSCMKFCSFHLLYSGFIVRDFSTTFWQFSRGLDIFRLSGRFTKDWSEVEKKPMVSCCLHFVCCNKNRLELFSRLFEESPAWFCSAPISLQWFSLYVSFSNICKATTVTHTKRIYRNLLRKETSFVYYTSSVLRKSRHMKQKEKITHCC